MSGILVRARVQSSDGRSPRTLRLGAGLPWRERWAVRRAIRRGEPSVDPTRRAVEVADAGVIVRTYPWLAAAALVGSVILGLMAGDIQPTRAVWIAYAMAVVLVYCAAVTLTSLAGARRYLAPVRAAG